MELCRCKIMLLICLKFACIQKITFQLIKPENVMGQYHISSDKVVI
jgi:hypothetical protein